MEAVAGQRDLDVEINMVCSRGSALEQQVLLLRAPGLLLEKIADPP